MDEAGEDWELLGLAQSPVSTKTPRDFLEMEGDSEGVIRPDYFSLDSDKRFERKVSEHDLSEGNSVESDNPSWVDPSSEPRYGDDPNREVGMEGIVFGSKNLGEFWSDSSSERSVSQKSDLECVGDATNEVAFEESGEGIGIESKSVEVQIENESGLTSNDYEQEFKAEGSNGSESSVMTEVAAESGEITEGMGLVEVKGVEEGKREIVWWKLPYELLRFCVFRVSPVWSLSIAATMVGIAILGRRLYRMKRKTRALPLKVTVDDKKVSQFMVRAARLNEAFSVVRRVPMIRSPLPAAGVTPWPVMSMR